MKMKASYSAGADWLRAESHPKAQVALTSLFEQPGVFLYLILTAATKAARAQALGGEVAPLLGCLKKMFPFWSSSSV